MARGAVIVILSDGWERGDPALVAREMERLARLAYRIVWVNPRVAAAGYEPRVGGMAAALPHIDALVSGHTLDAHARGDRGDRRRADAQADRAGARGRGMGERDPRGRPSRRHAQRLQPEPRKDDARMDSPLTTSCIYPGCDRPVVPPPEAGGPPSAFCDREDHNALTAHQERKRLEEQRWLTRPIARCSCASTRPGRWCSASPPRADGNEPGYAQLVADELGVPALDVKVVPADENRFGSGHGFNEAPSPGTPAAITAATGKILAKAQAARGRRPRHGRAWSGTTARS